LNELERVAAVGINCTAPVHIPSLIREARRVTDKPIIVYPNSGEHYDVNTKRWTGDADSQSFARDSVEWHATGASLIGGCCRTGPEHIQMIRRRFHR
jgi:homocysteine S-methyltransferase